MGPITYQISRNKDEVFSLLQPWSGGKHLSVEMEDGFRVFMCSVQLYVCMYFFLALIFRYTIIIPTQIAQTAIIKLLGQLEAAQQEMGDGLNLNFVIHFHKQLGVKIRAAEADLSGPLVSNVVQSAGSYSSHNWITDPPCLNTNVFQTPHLQLFNLTSLRL